MPLERSRTWHTYNTRPAPQRKRKKRVLDYRPKVPTRSVVGVVLERTFDIGDDHLSDKLVKRDLLLPAKLGLSLGRVAEQEVDLSGAEILLVDTDTDFARLSVLAHLVHTLALPDDLATRYGKRLLYEGPHRVRLSRRQHEVLRLVLLEHQPHPLDVVARMAPVTLRVKVTQIETFLAVEVDVGDGAGDLARDKGAACGKGDDSVRSRAMM
ncbi:hypothetical protein BC938DRAFT_478823 [Jimgerdemannia flammicorona]|uniref:Uncharacterized protein n=1 Tax=Jimgerdemannia flammicorona TaxID=994334 RepID=A0A433QM93_9FUNG|nr:hypothetical protein BC938DRAFT_478823 [Jimgerdemannia flammicorona]